MASGRSLATRTDDAIIEEILREIDGGLLLPVAADGPADPQHPLEPGGRRVAAYAVRLGREASCSTGALRLLARGGLVHGAGRIVLPGVSLAEPRRLNLHDMLIAPNFLAATRSPQVSLGPFLDMAPLLRPHHERFDGAGYPDGLRGEAIPLPARILSVADAFDAMTTARPYRMALPEERAAAMLLRDKGSQWDPDLVALFLERVLPAPG